MDSRRNFLRGLAQAATGASGEPSPSQPPAQAAQAVPRPPGGGTAGDAGTGSVAAPGRYADALSDPRWGAAAQAAVGKASVLILGAGGLASPVAAYLAGAGVGRLGVIDDGTVELSGLHAQHLHFTPDLELPRAHSAAAKLAFLNPEIVVEPYQVAVGAENAAALLAGHDMVVDCSGDDAVHQLVNATCCDEGVRLVTAAVTRRSGTVWYVAPGETACLHCAGFAPDPTSPGEACAVSGPLLGLIGSLQATVALDALAGHAPTAPATGLALDLERPELRRLTAPRRAECPVCGER